eukprot:TRINITY_DN47772_c0_g1_i1.p1 TRINITY_DN47772_c0_g1~~TRINITY_DN47772_c0_g1_i1.p1  ORF type:complete len:431 (+),score=84.89 TRINITY_DN47772_c0_g1_i1:68-1360(+)
MSRRGQISIDKIVAIRSSVLPLYVIVLPDGGVTAADEVSEDGNDFLTTRMHGDDISFQSIRGQYLSAEGDQICTRPYCGVNERFTVERKETKYAFRSRSGMYLSMSEREPFVGLAPQCQDTEVFHLFSLMMGGVNVGKQLEMVERTGSVTVENLLDDEQLEALRGEIAEAPASSSEPAHPSQGNGHERRVSGLALKAAGLARLAAHPLVLQLARRLVSCRLRLSDMESCRTDADHVRKELEATSWHVVHPYGDVEFPGIADARISFSAMWFLDDLDAANSTWAWLKAPLTDGNFSPMLPQLTCQEEIDSIVRDAKPLQAKRGSAWFYLGPMWLSNNVGAASFWKDYDAQTRYKHLSGQKELGSSFRALTDAQRGAQPKEELCPVVLQATYVREYVEPRIMTSLAEAGPAIASLEDGLRRDLEHLTAPRQR